MRSTRQSGEHGGPGGQGGGCPSDPLGVHDVQGRAEPEGAGGR